MMEKMMQTAASPRDTNPSCFGTMESAASDAATAARRVEDLADRLCGTVPAPAEAANPRAVPNGLFDAAMTSAQQVYDSNRRIGEAIARIERALP